MGQRNIIPCLRHIKIGDKVFIDTDPVGKIVCVLIPDGTAYCTDGYSGKVGHMIVIANEGPWESSWDFFGYTKIVRDKAVESLGKEVAERSRYKNIETGTLIVKIEKASL